MIDMRELSMVKEDGSLDEEKLSALMKLAPVLRELRDHGFSAEALGALIPFVMSMADEMSSSAAPPELRVEGAPEVIRIMADQALSFGVRELVKLGTPREVIREAVETALEEYGPIGEMS